MTIGLSNLVICAKFVHANRTRGVIEERLQLFEIH